MPRQPKINEKKVSFDEFYDNEWKDDQFYSPSELSPKFGTDRHLSRYYLMDMVYEKKLFRVKHKNKTSYGKRIPEHIQRIRDYTWMGVEVLT